MKRVYQTFNYAAAGPDSETLLTGIRTVQQDSSQVYISGTYVDSQKATHGLIYKGTLPCNEACNWHLFDYPSGHGRTVTSTAFYGPNNGLKRGTIEVVGNYTTKEGGKKSFGCLYQGPLDGSGRWTTIQPPGKKVVGVIVHSTMGGLALGNYEKEGQLPRAFIYDIKKQTYRQIKVPKGYQSITAYGIWHDAGDSFTICGGITTFNQIKDGSGRFKMYGYLANLDSEVWRIEDFSKYSAFEKSIITHFNGITSDNKGGYYLTGDNSDGETEAFFAHVKSDGAFSFDNTAKWSAVNYPKSATTSGNSVDQDVVLGVYKTKKGSIESYISKLTGC